jgi:hypothetical protein
MAVLMADPVLLPTSNYIMDRAQITRHLLTDQRDPMNRAPLTPDMLVPQVGLGVTAVQLSLSAVMRMLRNIMSDLQGSAQLHVNSSS